jgi:hypothetical protein
MQGKLAAYALSAAAEGIEDMSEAFWDNLIDGKARLAGK